MKGNDELKALRSMSIKELNNSLEVLKKDRLRANTLLRNRYSERQAQVKGTNISLKRINQSIARANTILLEKTRGSLK